MPNPDPIPDPIPDPTPSQFMARRFWRIMRLLALLAIVIAAIAVVLVANGDSSVHVNMLVATALGVGLTVLLGSGLMALMFLSASSGHENQAGKHHDEGRGQE